MNERKPQHYIWVTRPEYYLLEDGTLRDFKNEKGPWSCHRDTKSGDLVLFYFAGNTDYQGISKIVRATSDSYDGDDQFSDVCDIELVEPYKKGLNLQQLKSDKILKECSAVKRNFQDIAFKIEPEVYERCRYLLDKKKGQIVYGKRQSIDQKREPISDEKVENNELKKGEKINRELKRNNHKKNLNIQEKAEVEQAAIDYVTQEYEQKNWQVDSVEAERGHGYDLLCRGKGKKVHEELHLEVKGRSTGDTSFHLTKNEYDAAMSDTDFLLCLVTHATNYNERKLHTFTGKELIAKYSLTPMTYHCREK